jgi:hypothetical protein
MVVVAQMEAPPPNSPSPDNGAQIVRTDQLGPDNGSRIKNRQLDGDTDSRIGVNTIRSILLFAFDTSIQLPRIQGTISPDIMHNFLDIICSGIYGFDKKTDLVYERSLEKIYRQTYLL